MNKFLKVLSENQNKIWGNLIALIFVQIMISTTHADYYTIDAKVGGRESNPTQFNLLGFKKASGNLPKPEERYDRAKHFGTWVNLKSDRTCLNTRGQVLERDSLSKVSKSRSCSVTRGEWHDPYTDSYKQSAREIEIDHVVALSNAYRSGGFEWSPEKRCLYANYMGNNFHLLSVDAQENQNKLDYDPSRYIPPSKAFTCEYLVNWLKIKFIWSLRLTNKEMGAISRLVDSEGCDKSKFRMSRKEYANQQTYIRNNLNYCKQ